MILIEKRLGPVEFVFQKYNRSLLIKIRPGIGIYLGWLRGPELGILFSGLHRRWRVYSYLRLWKRYPELTRFLIDWQEIDCAGPIWEFKF